MDGGCSWSVQCYLLPNKYCQINGIKEKRKTNMTFYEIVGQNTEFAKILFYKAIMSLNFFTGQC